MSVDGLDRHAGRSWLIAVGRDAAATG